MNDEQARERGHKAAAILRDLMTQEAFDAIERKLVGLMVTAKSDEATLKGKAMIGLLHDLRAHWQRVVTDGAIAAETIRIEEERKKHKWYQRAA